jgi:hypothetical protein
MNPVFISPEGELLDTRNTPTPPSQEVGIDEPQESMGELIKLAHAEAEKASSKKEKADVKQPQSNI